MTAEGATPRPWAVNPWLGSVKSTASVAIVGESEVRSIAPSATPGDDETDAALIVAAVNDYDRLRAIEAAARAALDALSFYVSDGRDRVDFPVDRDGVSEPGSEAPFLTLRSVLLTKEEEG